MGVILGWVGGGTVYAIILVYLFIIEPKHNDNN